MLPESWTLYPETLAKYKNPVFVETGTHLGGGIAVALNVGFEEIHSVDIERHLYDNALRLYGGDPKVRLYLGNAATLIGPMLNNINRPVTFWLDAHDGLTSTLWPELHAIAQHPIKTHTILIDDRQWWKTWRLEENAIREFLLSINPNYNFLHEKNKYAPDDIFVAKV